MLIRTVNTDGRVRITATNSAKAFLLLGAFLTVFLYMFFDGYKKHILADNNQISSQLYYEKTMTIGGLGASFFAFIIVMKILIILRGGYRIILSQDKIVRLIGTKKSWSSWQSLNMFEPVDGIASALNAKIIGPDCSDDLKRMKEFLITLAGSKSDMLELMHELNGYYARANNFDPNQIKELKTKTENQVVQNDKNYVSRIKRGKMHALWILVFMAAGLIAMKFMETFLAIPAQRSLPYMAVFLLIAAGLVAKRRR